jgi:predicted PurR-regulated permease PerM
MQEPARPPQPMISASLALRVGFAAAVLVLAVLTAPFVAWLVPAAWLSHAVQPWLAPLTKKMGGPRAAAILTLTLLVVILGPVVALAGSLTLDALELGARLGNSQSGREALAQLVSGDGEATAFDIGAVFAIIERHGARALELAGTLAGIGAEVALGLFVFFSAAYALLIHGPAAWKWTVAHAPLNEAGLERLNLAFHETGRGLFVGIGLTGLLQATIATIAYFALGVPRALVLGLVTFFASVLPTIGTALVWVPICIGLALTGRTTAALILALVGIIVVSSIDNLLRPMLTRFGQLQLPTFVLLIAMLSGLALMGPAGLFLGPLLARMSVEIVRMAREAGLVGDAVNTPNERMN